MDEDLSKFSLEDLFEDEKRRKSYETVDHKFRRPESLSPLDYLIRVEEKDELREYAHKLKDFLYEHLDWAQIGFVTREFGKEWERHHRLPLEFRHFTRKEFDTYLKAHVDEIREKINILLEHCGEATYTNRGRGIQEFIHVPFNLATQDRIIEIYEQVQTGVVDRYPAGFFHPDNERVPRILTKHLVDNVLQLPHTEHIPEQLTPKRFYDHNLSWMLEQYFAGNVKRALQHAYTQEEFPSLYKDKYETHDVLREVFIQLKATTETTLTLKTLKQHQRAQGI